MIERLEENIPKQIACKRPSSIKQWPKYKIFELKYANSKIIKYTGKICKLVLAVFASTFASKLALN